ncbi:hypothetical protein LG296_11045 [Ureibacillus chungkukjangi]|uniref:Phage integrase family protein n=2 Tax=Ureibacillus chungkukjangi TaxID=1202712 RepID=A0A318TD00_9BACL|nr:hypothetical protein BJ095_1391 [Ureibacillus chungkukjangi]
MMQRLNEMIEIKDNTNNFSKVIRNMIINFYLYVANNFLLEEENINKIKHLLINREVRYVIPYSKIREGAFFYTNYPKCSNPENIYQLLIDDKKSVASRLVNINFNTNNTFLFKLFEQFTLHCISNLVYEDSFTTPKERINHVCSRAFFYFFEESLKGDVFIKEDISEKVDDIQQLNTLAYFNPSKFIKQYKFFKKLDREVNAKSFNSGAYLIKFYLYIDEISIKKNGVSILDKGIFRRDFLFYNKMLTHIELGYEILVLSPFEPIPLSNKWCVVPNNKEKFTSELSRSNYYINFTEVKNKYLRDELKTYIWNYKNSHSVLKGVVPRLINFLNEFDKYRKEFEKLTTFYNNKLSLLDDFLLLYCVTLKNRKTNKGETLKESTYLQTINQIKQYLRFYQEKYNIPELTIQNLKVKTSRLDGGNPFEADDFKEIKNEFIKLKENSKTVDEQIDSELINIIFSLSCQTKLRLGEICNLKRDCIKSISESMGIGEISYISKTSNGESVPTYLLVEDIQLIQKAIDLTEEYNDEATLDNKGYVFLTMFPTKRMSNRRIGRVYAKYRLNFKNIIKSLHKAGRIRTRYEPNDARDTFIDSAWKQVESGNITPAIAAQISGNTARVAANSYRKQLDKDYLEATYMITIGGREVDGSIVDNEMEIEKLQQVVSGAGACNSKNCIKQNEVYEGSVDSEYLCLTCRKFVTSSDRVDIFERYMNFYHEKEEEAETINEKRYYNSLVELYGSYLTEILHFQKENIL